MNKAYIEMMDDNALLAYLRIQADVYEGKKIIEDIPNTDKFNISGSLVDYIVKHGGGLCQ